MTRLGTKALAAVLVALMMAASLFLWLGIPLIWLYIASQLVDTSQPTMGPYLVVVFGIAATVFVDAFVISRLNRQYQRLTGSRGNVRVQLPWLKSMRGERDEPGGMTVLDTILIASVLLAGLTMAVWFLAFAGSSLPGG
jgi:hypothetical protein